MTAKLNSHLVFDLTPDQIERAKDLLDGLKTNGGMIIGSLKPIRNENSEVVHRVGFRLVDLPTAEQLIEIANGEGENENA